VTSSIVRSATLLLVLFLTAQTLAAPPAEYGKVEVVRDHWGVPHVFSDTDEGAMYGLGYAAAEDRAFQMYYALRIIQGRLAEVLGERPSVARPKETTLDHDRKMRTFGLYGAARENAARQLDDLSLSWLKAYSAGVNDYTSQNRDRLHPLFAETGLEPEPWTPADCLASWYHLGQFFAGDGTRELLHYRNLKNPPPAARGRGPVVAEPRPAWFNDAAAVVTRDDVTDEWLAEVRNFASRHKVEPPPGAQPAQDGPKFSHAWVVGGKKTTTGAAVLVSDPQTPVRFPSLWHEFHVSGKRLNARGVGVPGCPALLIGWNANVAWGATALGVDQADLFRLKTDEDHVDQYLFDGQWRPMGLSRETVRVKGGEPVEMTIRRTHLGPVVTEFAFAAPNDPPVALKRVPLTQPGPDTVQAVFGMMLAGGAEELQSAVAGWHFPSANLVFGDRRGNVGYQFGAAVPIRSSLDEHRGSAALEGTSSQWDWQGFVPGHLLPRTLNPPRGWVASGNHRPVGSFYPLPLGISTGSMGHTIRSRRLYERLGAKEKFTPQDVLDIHFDDVNAARRDIVRLGLHARDTGELSPDAVAALKVLAPWLAAGARSDFGQPGAALAGQINTFFRFVNTPLAAEYGGGETGISRWLGQATKRLADDPKALLDDRERGYLDSVLTGAWRSAREQYGDDPAKWESASRRRVQSQKVGYCDSLDGFGSLDRQLDLTVPDLDCVDGGTIRSQAAQSYTQYVPLHDVDRAMSLLPPGHSEWPDDPRSRSTLTRWEAGTLHPAPLSRAAVDKLATGRKVLSAGK